MAYRMSKCALLIFAAMLSLAIQSATSAFAEGRPNVQIDADKITFEEDTGVAIAEGNVMIHNSEMRLYSPYVEYFAGEGSVRARSTTEGHVTFVTQAGRLTGESLEYNFNTREGLVMSPSGSVEAFYVKGAALHVRPQTDDEISRAKRRGRIDASSDDMAALWTDAVVTTCSRSEPHYRFEARSINVIEGQSITIKSPKVYIGNTHVFTYPFDYRISLLEVDKRKTQTIMPRVGYESKKGAGIGISAGWGWESGYIDLTGIAWTQDIYEGDLLFMQDIGRDLSVYANIERAYDKDRDETKWRPGWGMRYKTDSGWLADLAWAQRKLITIEERAGVDTRHVVWQEPELNIMSPWFDDRAAGGKFRLLGTWGRYEDALYAPGQRIDRYGLGAQIKGDLNSNREKFRPFYNAVYWYYKYDKDSWDEDGGHQVLEAVLGAQWELGDFDMETAYLRRWNWGRSPMAWDDYRPREEVYQSVAYAIPTKDKDVKWRLGVRAAYDIREKEISEMVYRVGYDVHCMLWEAVYRDDRYGTDNWFGLKLSLNAFPDSGARLMGSDIFDPKDSPDELVPLQP